MTKNFQQSLLASLKDVSVLQYGILHMQYAMLDFC